MKAFLPLLLAIFSFNLHSQITLEETYADAAENLYMVKLENSGMKFIKVSRAENNRFIHLYNLDHSLWKTINCNAFPLCYFPNSPDVDLPNYDFDVLYLSENLFDLDNGLEFMFTSRGFQTCFTAIYNEDGSQIFYQENAFPGCRLNIPQQQYPIYNTPDGTKMILSFPNTGEAKVYSLSGVLNVNQMGTDPLSATEFNVFPNPSQSATTIEYKLPNHVSSGQIEIHDLSGKLVKAYEVDQSFQNLVIGNGEISSGTYLYSLKTENTTLACRKIIIE